MPRWHELYPCRMILAADGSKNFKHVKLDLFNLHAICKSDKQDIMHEEEAAEAALNHISQMPGVVLYYKNAHH
jgi:hypothetical protein